MRIYLDCKISEDEVVPILIIVVEAEGSLLRYICLPVQRKRWMYQPQGNSIDDFITTTMHC
jgi:hypothetical protein